jgi:type IV pilus assembly protein PilB
VNPKSIRAVITSNKVVARFLDGRILKGWCLSFHPEKPVLKIEAVDRTTSYEIDWEDLKALFFVREFEGLKRGSEDAVLAQASPVSKLSQHVHLEFLDGEVIQGYAEGLKRERKGFFITPMDPQSNNLRIFIPRTALRKLNVAQKLGETMVLEGMVRPKDMKRALGKQKAYRETRLGEVIVSVGMTSPEEVERALNVQRVVGQKLGRILVQADILTERDLEKALAVQQDHRKKRLGEILVEMRLATSESVALALALKYRLPYVDPSLYPVDAEAVTLVGERIARRFKFIPIAKNRDGITIAIDDPINFGARDHVHSALGLRAKEVLATPEAIQEAIDRFYKTPGPKVRSRGAVPAGAAEKNGSEDKLSSPLHERDDEAIAALLEGILKGAVEKGASGIHINPERQSTVVSFRIDGVLHAERTLDMQLHPRLISRVKIIGNMNIAERGLPQEGRTRLRIGEKVFDMRISSLPAIWGESLVINLMEKSPSVVKLKDLGFSRDDRLLIRNFLKSSQGVILVSGPGGSGKSTTLYGCLREPVFEGKNLITIEDRIEHECSNATQILIKPHTEMTYANTLRQSLSHDPDVIVLGDIPDAETARLALHAALSGRLVLGAVSTPTASETLDYLLNMGIEPYLVASGLLAIISQRLVRRICPSEACRQEDGDAVKRLGATGIPPPPFRGITFWKGKGCDACRSGYKGRGLIYEILRMEGPIKRAVVEGKGPRDLQTLATKSTAMRTLWDAGFLLAKTGVTTVEELLALSLPHSRYHIGNERSLPKKRTNY